MKEEQTRDHDSSEAFRVWAELVAFGHRMALSTRNATPEEEEAALLRLARGMELENQRRDEAWRRISEARSARGT